jgi:hypothetical protein
MKAFPKLYGTEVALLRSEFSTGIVLNKDYNKSLNSNDEVYTVFDTKEDAIIYIESTLSNRSNTEFVLYDKDQNVLQYIQPS